MANFNFADIAHLLQDSIVYNATSTATAHEYDANGQLIVDADGTSLAVAPDLSNIMDFGKEVSSGSIDFTTTANNIVNKIRRQVIEGTSFTHTGIECYHSNEDWAGITEVYRVDIGNLSASLMFDAVTDSNGAYVTTGANENSFADLFGKELPTLKARYFEKAMTYRKKITIAPTQFANAFVSPAAMSQFINEIWRKLDEQWRFTIETLEYLAFMSAVSRVVYERETAATGSAVVEIEDTTAKDTFVQIMSILDDFRAYNNKWSADDYVSSVSEDDLVCYMYAPLYDKIFAENTMFNANTEAISKLLSKFKRVPCFGQPATPDTIEVAPATVGGTYNASTFKTYKIDNIKAVICDKRLFGCTSYDEKMTSQYVANEDVTNYFHMATLALRCNSDLPLVVLTDSGSTDAGVTTAQAIS